MDIPISELHQQLLEQEAASVSFADLDELNILFDAKIASQPCIIATPFATVQMAIRLRKLLSQPEKLTDRQLLLALGAMRYFVRDEDHSDDTHGGCGTDDDAQVLHAAVQQLDEPLRALAI